MSEEKLEYEHYCNEQLRNKITNLEYKIKRLEEDNKYKQVIDKIKEWLEEDLKQQYRDCGHRNNIIREVYNKLNELLEEIDV